MARKVFGRASNFLTRSLAFGAAILGFIALLIIPSIKYKALNGHASLELNSARADAAANSCADPGCGICDCGCGGGSGPGY